jgi:hypothetical protein
MPAVIPTIGAAPVEVLDLKDVSLIGHPLA